MPHRTSLVMNQLKQVHAYNLRNGIIEHNKFLIVELLQFPNITYARNVFDQIPHPNVFLYNKLIQGYSSQNQPHQCLALYTQMRLKNCPPNQHSFTFLFAAFASLRSLIHAQILHTHFVKSGFQSHVLASTSLVDLYAKLGRLTFARKAFDEMHDKDIPTWNSIITGYAKCGDMEGALELFGLMPSKNVVSWTAIISGYTQNGHYEEALSMFLEMETEKGSRPNAVTIASVMPACSHLGALEVGKRIEKYARENGFFNNIYVSNAVLEMYARCGRIDGAREVFNEIGKRRNLCTWNSMIMGLAVHGKCCEALELYEQILIEGTAPDDVTFVGLLLACTHGGMVRKGRELFESMETKFKITPKLEHYGCMVDLFGRAGELQEAYELIQTMPMRPDSVIWGALLGACSFHVNVELGEIAAESLFKLEPWNPGNYVILSNIYALARRWDGVAKLRKVMKHSEITKAAGYSLIEEGGDIHKFIVEDKTHPSCHEIYALLNEVSTKMKLQRNETYSGLELEELCTLE
ncbi:hypothetical protein JRO89_XS01G0338600 [Xanthoceras sorbifolium]|uniref:Pentatricopeptide repeat-containing protein n=1 Tax=Xanthoceras sorbifolium TaxID=99658 RepID=A0ABQ8IN17_9ROSI|nr:hypothetical protein JRO89_XS01G0338600 [Xanthoceras sorbifolium]